MRFELLIVLLSVLLSARLSARLSKNVDAHYEVVSSETTYNIAKNGSYTLYKKLKIKVLSEKGRDKYSLYKINYLPQSESIKLLNLYSETDGKKIKLNDRYITENFIESKNNGFDSVKQIQLAFNQINIGSLFQIEYLMTVKKNSIPNFFSYTKYFGVFKKVLKAKYIIESEVPLAIEINDKHDFLDIKKSGNGYIITLKKAIFIKYSNEDYDYDDYSIYPWFHVSTLKHWKNFAKDLIPIYEKIAGQTLPAVHLEIYNLAKKIKVIDLKSFKQQLNIVTSKLAAKIRYMGDWRTVDGAYIPRSLAEISMTSFGDCKDYSASVVAILRKLGHRAYYALVYRGEKYEKVRRNLPHASSFNHAIVYVDSSTQMKDKINMWVDATNSISFAGYIRSDIANRASFIMDPAHPRLGMTNKSLLSAVELKYISKFNQDDKMQVNVKYTAIGSASIAEWSSSFAKSKDEIKNNIVTFFSNNNFAGNWNVDLNFDGTRVLKKFVADLKYKQKFSTSFRTTKGKLLRMPEFSFYNKIYINTRERVSGLFLGENYSHSSEMIFKEIEVLGDINMGCKLDSPWFSAARSYLKIKRGALVRQNYVIKKRYISNKELKSDQFKNIQIAFKKCFYHVGLVYRNLKN